MFKKIDLHVHTRLFPCPPRSEDPQNTYCTPEQLIEKQDEYGIERMVILPGVNPECHFGVQSNEEAIVICEKYPDRFSWFMNLDPRAVSNSPKADFTRVLNYYKERGAKGLGEICANLPFDDPRCLKLFADCEKCNVPVLFHMTLHQGNDYGLIDELGLPRLEKVLGMFPNLVFFAHSQAFWAHMSADIDAQGTGGYPTGKVTEGRVAELMRKYPNLHGDLSAGSGGNAVMRDEEYGLKFLHEFADRLHYGTDFCAPFNVFKLGGWLDKMLAEGKLSEEDYTKICRTNTAKFLGIEA